MNCMKCGKEAAPGQAFCSGCLEEMAQRPVTPGTVILLPEQMKQPPKKTAPKAKSLPTKDEQLALLRVQVKRLRILVLVLALLVAGLAFIARRAISELDFQRLLGQNYSTVQESEESTGPSETAPTT